MNWVDYFRNLTHQIKLKSKDEKTQIGVLIVGTDNEIISTGYNSFPRGLNDDDAERQERPEKYFWFGHAERNAIYNAARIGVSTKGTTMYMSCGLPCVDCARAVVQAGIKTIYCERGGGAKGEKWLEHYHRTTDMFNECGVEVIFYDEL